MNVCVYIIGIEREREREQRDTVVKEMRGCKKRRQPSVTSRLHRAAHAQLTIVREKNLPSKFCATAHEARGSCSSRALDRESGGTLSSSRRKAIEEEEEGTESAGGPIGCYRYVSFFKEFLPRPLTIFFVSLLSIRDFPLYYRLSLPLLFCLLRHEKHRIHRGRGIRFHVYTLDGSDWPGLKPSQITP